jgi:hypothetical protein
MAYAWKFCAAQNPATLKWGETGPRLVAKSLSLFALEEHLHPPEVFCPLSFRDWENVLEPGRDLKLSERSASIHLWNEMWRHSARNKEGDYPRDCPYVRLQEMYLTPESAGAK